MKTYLCQNRHGTYYFRFIIPDAYRSIFQNKREIRRSLRTDSKKIALKRARLYRVRFDLVLEQLEVMTKKDDEKLIQTGYIEFASLFGGTNKVDFGGDEVKENSARQKILDDEIKAISQLGLKVADRGVANCSVPDVREPSVTNWEEFSNKYVADLVRRNHIKKSTAEEYLSCYMSLSSFVGSGTPLTDFTDELLSEFYDSLADKSISTRNKYLTRIKSVFDHAVKKKIINLNPAGGVITEKDKVRDKDRREIFTNEDLRVIFESDYYIKNKWRQRTNRVRTPYTFWMFPLGLFTGARMSELMLLETANVLEEGGIHYINLVNELDPITGETILTLKNNNSIRKIPISDELIKMGFLEFVIYCKKRKQKYLFDDITDKVTKQGAGQKVLSSRLKSFGVWMKDKKSFHSFRHTFITSASASGVDLVKLGAVTGHLSKAEHSLVPELMNTYHKGFPIRLLKEEVIDKLKFDIDLSGLRWL